ncbi:membrane-bound lytic murein transglycosylase B [Devosia subaequoris]|uniref:Membrane-bound lytic murein transglycosylase B n=1 Tax=Devosia subaequoris TaxID=395930 RepID=A0A7W6INN3_9HYPH|nr:lytic murein transglycosylase [Devosia subaequoris]MBB4052522.1 membrane-bound lytic murein transglycosylase B [Devosia subaequoris]MCP1209680.1 lytic murein transglycosylase [Devosia subaequoris]
MIRSGGSFNFLRLLMGAVLAGMALMGPAQANSASFVRNLWPEAERAGVSRQAFEAAFASYNPIPQVIELTKKQPEFTQTVQQYVDKRVTAAQAAKGQAMRGEWAQTLAGAEQRYGVQPEIVLAIWGMETNFGGFMGGNNTIHALATLTEKGYRASFFRSELVTALRIVSDGHISPNAMVGSWAGAMGHTQFMPSSFMRYAVDYNGDGRKDIWNSVPDALGSTANYLKSFNWRPGETWGYEVKLPQGFNFAAAREMGKAPLSQWQAMGISRASGSAFPRPNDMARLYMPAGASGPAFLLLPNFDVIKRYNNSDSYALAVGHLADRILGGGSFVTPWPSGDYALSKAQRAEVQSLLGRAGFDVGTADGVVGPKTRAGVIAYQQARGLPADGHVSGLLLERLKR